MNRTVLFASGGLVVGLVLVVAGTVLLGRARAVAKHSGLDGRAGADVAQYAAGFTALLGFLAVAAGGAVAVTWLLPWAGALRLGAAVVSGVVLFAVTGALSARLANRVEEKRAVSLRPVRTFPAPARSRAAPTDPPPPPAQTSSVSPPASVWGEPPTGAGLFAPTGVESPSRASPARATLGESFGDDPGSPDDVGIVDQPVRPGWVYQDQAGAWYMGVTTDSGRPHLLELPNFTLVGDRPPAYPLHPAGAGEVAVVPLPTADVHDPDSL